MLFSFPSMHRLFRFFVSAPLLLLPALFPFFLLVCFSSLILVNLIHPSFALLSCPSFHALSPGPPPPSQHSRALLYVVLSLHSLPLPSSVSLTITTFPVLCSLHPSIHCLPLPCPPPTNPSCAPHTHTHTHTAPSLCFAGLSSLSRFAPPPRPLPFLTGPPFSPAVTCTPKWNIMTRNKN